MSVLIDAHQRGAMLKVCLNSLLRPKRVSAAVSVRFKYDERSRKHQTSPRTVGDGSKMSARKAGPVSAGVAGLLDRWMDHKPPVSHENLVKCLYRCLQAAREEQLSSSQLLQDPGFRRFWDQLCAEVPNMSANLAVMGLYNCAQYDFAEDADLLSSLLETCSRRVRDIPPKAFGILLWSLCRLNLYQQNLPLVDDIVRQFHSELVSQRQLKPQAFANVLWALATTQTWPAFVTPAVLQYVSDRAADFDFHSLSIVLWSVTRANLTLSDTFLEVAGDRAALLLQTQFQVISLVHCCWAFGSAAYFHQPFFSALTDKLLSEPPATFTPRLLSSAAWACARTGYYHPGLLDHIARTSLSTLHHFNSHDLGNLAFSYGYLNHRSDNLLLAISDIMSSRPEVAANELSCANVANACLIHKLYPEALLSRLMCPSRISALLQSWERKHLHLCVQIHFLVQAERPELEHCILQPPHNQIVPALVVADSMVNCQRVYSVFHHNMCKALLQITGSTQCFTKEALTTFASFIDAEMILDSAGRPLPIPSHWGGWSQPQHLLHAAYPRDQHGLFWKEVDHCTRKTGLLERDALEEVCVASDWAESLGDGDKHVIFRKVAFEADGPRHYAVNCRHKLGNTAIKHRLLRSQGWDVIAVAHFEWEGLNSDQDQINFLANKLYNNN